jgi:hypothetical protein
MSVSQTPNQSFSIAVGGRAGQVYVNSIRSLNYLNIMLSFQQSVFTNESTTGTLRFEVTYVPFSKKDTCIKRCVYVTQSQISDSYNETVPGAFKQVLVKVTSDDDTDTGVTVGVTLVGFKQGYQKSLRCSKPITNTCKKKCPAVFLPCPEIVTSTLFPNPATTTDQSFRLEGKNLMVLKLCCPYGPAMYSTLLNIGLLTQGSSSVPVLVTPVSTDVISIFVFPTNVIFAEGSAYFTLYPHAGCPTGPITVPVTLDNPNSSTDTKLIKEEEKDTKSKELVVYKSLSSSSSSSSSSTSITSPLQSKTDILNEQLKTLIS